MAVNFKAKSQRSDIVLCKSRINVIKDKSKQTLNIKILIFKTDHISVVVFPITSKLVFCENRSGQNKWIAQKF